MAFTDITLQTHVQVAQDSQSIKVWDESTWNGEEIDVDTAKIQLFFIDDNEETIPYDDYDLLTSGGDTTKWDEFLSRDAHVINIADIYLGAVAIGDRFIDGYYVVRLVINDATYTVGVDEPYYDNNQAFLAKYRCMKRKLPAKLLGWPLTDDYIRKNWDIFLLGLYLESAENAVDLGKKVQFRSFIAKIRGMFDYYKVENCW